MPSKTQSILIGGVSMAVAAAITGFIPIAGGCLTCLAVLASGLVAVWHYTSTYDLTISGGTGAGMGAAAGVVVTIAGVLIGLVLSVLGLRAGFAEGQQAALQGLENSGLNPAQLDQAREIVQSAAFPAVVVGCTLFIYVILATIGGAIGASVFKKGGSASGTTPATPTRSDAPQV